MTIVAGRNARPISQGVVAEHPLQVQGAEEEHPEHPGDRAAPGSTLAPETLRERKIRSGISGLRGRRLAHDEGGEQRERDGAEPERRGPSPSRSRPPA